MMKSTIRYFFQLVDNLADDALRIFRVDLFLIAVYVSFISISSRGATDISPVFNSPYTIFGLLFWFGSISVAILQYRLNRNASLTLVKDESIDIVEEHNPEILVQNIVMASIAALISVYG